jgi:tetratricopeptide (TPR) repeat protein
VRRSPRPDDAYALWAKALVLAARHKWDAAILEGENARDADRNLAVAHGFLGMWHAYVGRAGDGFSEVETAIKLSPYDPVRPIWDYILCHLHTQLAQWDQAIPPCLQSLAANPQLPYPNIDLTAAYGWLGRASEAKAALADLLKQSPGFTVEKANSLFALYSDNPVYNQQNARMAEGLRKAGLPER